MYVEMYALALITETLYLRWTIVSSLATLCMALL